MENSPPGIHTMPGGVGPGGGDLFSTVGRNEEPSSGAAGDAATATGVVVTRFERVAGQTRIAAATATAPTSHGQTLHLTTADLTSLRERDFRGELVPQ
jgi:hypothetical protein